jgi:hypothetical protein
MQYLLVYLSPTSGFCHFWSALYANNLLTHSAHFCCSSYRYTRAFVSKLVRAACMMRKTVKTDDG